MIQREKLEANLAVLKAEYRDLSRHPGKIDAFKLNLLIDEILDLERGLAKIDGSEYATPWELPPKWAFSKYQSPAMLGYGSTTVLLYSITLSENKSQESTAILSFSGCAACRLGSPNDETISGHPLFGKGIDVGGAYTVVNSHWLIELEKINAKHDQFSLGEWQNKNHYLILFKNNTFDCIANSVIIDVLRLSLPGALGKVVSGV